MPLSQGKSKKAFSHNVKAEMDAGKPQKQALAIAYSTQRHNAKKMAKGGLAKSASPEQNYDMPAGSEARIRDGHAGGKCPHCGHDGDAMLAKGGMAASEGEMYGLGPEAHGRLGKGEAGGGPTAKDPVGLYNRGGMALTEKELHMPIEESLDMLHDGGMAGERMLRGEPRPSDESSGSPTLDRAVRAEHGRMNLTEEIMQRRGLEQQDLDGQRMAVGGMIGEPVDGDDSQDAFEHRAEYSTHLDDQDAGMPTEEHDDDHSDEDHEIGLVGQILKRRRMRSSRLK